MQQEEIRVETKRTGDEYTSRLGYFVGPVVDKANMGWYEKICKQIGRVKDEEIELKKQVVYEGKENEWCITLHGISSNKEQLDMAMRQMKFSENSHIKYVSFSNSTHNERIEALQLNKFINIKLKYECLKNVGVLDKVYYQNKEKTVSEILMNAKKDRIPLFHGIEQGLGKNENYVYIYFKETRAAEAREWIHTNYDTTFTVKNKIEYITSLPAITPEEVGYHKDLNDYIIDRIKEIRINTRDQNI